MQRDIRQKVQREFAAKRDKALSDAARRKDELYRQVPALADLDRQAAELSCAHFRAKMTGNADEQKYTADMNKIAQNRKELMGGADIEPHFECETCQDTGKVAGGYCNCFLNRVIEENLLGANLSVSSAHERFENFTLKYYSDQPGAKGLIPRERMKEILAKCKRFATEFDQPHKNLLLAGTSGLGKTFLSSAIAHCVLEQGYTVIYMSANEFFARAQANKFGDNAEEMESYYTADLLILDDLGTEFRTQLTSSVLGEVIDRRLRSGKKMVLSTNLTATEMENNYSPRIISRLMGSFEMLKFYGNDIRVIKKGS